MKRTILLFTMTLSLFSFLFSSTLSSLLPEIEGWKLSEQPKLFNSGNLYEHINGGAEAYLAFGFRELLVAYYEKENSSLTLEIYDMGNHYNSFGIYSIERSPDYQFLDIGNQGYTDGENLFLITGPFYIKIFCSECGEKALMILLSFAKEIVERVKDKGELPEVLKYFPEKGLIKNSEKFFPYNFLGIDFLKNGFQAEYKLNDEKFYLFIIEEEREETFEKFRNYLERRKGFESFTLDSTVGFLAEDRVHGKISILKRGKYIIGYLGQSQLEKIKGYLMEIIKKIGG